MVFFIIGMELISNRHIYLVSTFHTRNTQR